MILVDSRLQRASARLAVAHEIVHSIFYERPALGLIPKRIRKWETAEEHFCFDVGRRLLAPRSLLKRVAGDRIVDCEATFRCLIESFQVSRQVAARILFQDFEYFTGWASRWVLSRGKWSMDVKCCVGSKDLSATQRRKLRDHVPRVIEGVATDNAFHWFQWIDAAGKGVFVVAYKAQSEG